MSEHFPIEEARHLPIEARSDELAQLEKYVDTLDEEIDAQAIRRHIIARRAIIVALATRPADGDVKPEARSQSLFGRTVSEWHTFLTGPNLDVPSSRYGRNASEVAWWAVASLVIYDAYMGEPDEIDEFANHSMSMVVNDDDSVGKFVEANREFLPQEVLRNLTMEGGDV